MYDDGNAPRISPYLMAFLLTLHCVGASLSWAQAPRRASGCDWVPGFHVSGLDVDSTLGLYDLVQASAVFDDGNGPALYVGGTFQTADDVLVSSLAKWDGISWSAVPGRANELVFALASFDDGNGPALYVGGMNGVLRFDGISWSTPGAGITTSVKALVVYDSGTGPALYAAGGFSTAGGISAANIARWNGISWAPLGSGTDSSINSLAVLNDGSGNKLFAGGNFTQAGGVPASYVARWNGTTWAPLAGGVLSPVTSMAAWNDGSGAKLYVNAPTTDPATSMVSQWNGESWSPLGSTSDLSARSLATFDDGSGNALYAGGQLGVGLGFVSKWSGSTWSTLGSGMSRPVSMLKAFDDGSGNGLFLGGPFLTVDGARASGIARWRGGAFSVVTGVPGGKGLSSGISGMTLHDDGSGKALYAKGSFLFAGDLPVPRSAKWDGQAWSVFGSDLIASGIASFDDGNGAAICAFRAPQWPLYPAGLFYKLEGDTWIDPPGSTFMPAIYTTLNYDDGSGVKLYAGGYGLTFGDFTSAIASWDGMSWTPLSGGPDGSVYDLAAFDDGNGLALYAAGDFTALEDQTPAAHIAKWDGKTWSAVGGGFDGDVYTMAVWNDSNGNALYFGGPFSNAGGVSAARIAKWNGSTWSALGGGLNNYASDLAVFNDGAGEALYVTGSFTEVEGLPIRYTARWDGSAWSALGTGDGVQASQMQVFDNGSGEALYFSGGFYKGGGGKAARGFAQFCQPGVFGDGFESGDTAAWSLTVP